MADPIQKQYKNIMNALAKGIDDILNPVKPKTVGFVLLMFPFGDVQDGKVNYISNGNREDVIASMKEFIARSEGQYQEGPATKQ